MQKQQGISTLVGVIIVIAVAVITVGGVFAYQYFATPKVSNQSQAQNQTAGWKTFTNEQFGVIFSYPDSLSKIVENNNGYNGKYDVDFYTPKDVADINEGSVYIREATGSTNPRAESEEEYYMRSARTIDSEGGVKFYLTDVVGKSDILSRVYAFKNKSNKIILVWFGTSRDVTSLIVSKSGDELDRAIENIFKEIIEYQDFNKMLGTFKLAS